jgi:hypothetical protein
LTRTSTLLSLIAVPVGLAATTGCAAKIDRFTIDRVVAVGTDVPDTGKVCHLGAALAHPLASLSKNAPHKALVIAEVVAALCDEHRAYEAELATDRAKANLGALGAERAAEITDARVMAERAHADAAGRFERSFQHLVAAYGEIGGDECPKIKEKDEIAYLLGLVGGTLALIHDKRGGNQHDIPLDRLLVVARGSECLDDERWWHAPAALRAGAWATIPGSGPEGVDAWQLLDEAAAAGETSGVRVGRAIQALIGGNAGRTEVAEAAIRGHAASLESTPMLADYALLDRYAFEVSRHESDRIWVAAEGHRTEVFGTLPSDEEEEVAVPDLFSGDDPFATPAPAEPDDAEESPSDDASEGDSEATPQEETP